MPNYHYNGISFSGQLLEGEMVARNQAELQEILQGKSVFLLNCESPSTPKLAAAVNLQRWHKELAPFTRQMGTMLDAGMPLDEAIEILQDQARSRKWKELLGSVLTQIRSGQQLSEVLEKYSEVFNGLYVSMVRAGESTGKLNIVLDDLSHYLENRAKMAGKIRSALVYPLTILLVSLMVLTVLLVYVIPTFREIFSGLQIELPRITLLVIGLSSFVRENLLLILFAFFFICALAWVGRHLHFLRLLLDALALRVPVIGRLIRKGQLAHFCLTMHTLLSSGVELTDSIQAASTVVTNVRLGNLLRSSIVSVMRGDPMHQAWEKSDIIPMLMTRMVATGEKTGELAFMFGKIGRFYMDEMESLAPAITSIIEPVLIVMMGVIVAGILLSMYLPLFELMGQLG